MDYYVVGAMGGGVGEDEVGGDVNEDTQEKEKRLEDHYVFSVILVNAHPPEVRLETFDLVINARKVACIRYSTRQ